MTQAEMTEFFGEPISIYSREQAIEDGILADLSALLPQLVQEHFGLTKVACTSALWELVEKAVNHPKWMNDTEGVWHDIFWMAQGLKRKLKQGTITDGEPHLFRVVITGTGRRRNHILKVVSGRDGSIPTLTFMLRDED